MSKIIVNTHLAPSPVGPYNQAVLAGNTLYVSGQISIDQTTGQLVLNNIEDETHQVMKTFLLFFPKQDLPLKML